MSLLLDILQGAKLGFERVKQTPAREFFLPTSKAFKQKAKETGALLQRFPETRLEPKIPEAPKTGSALLDTLFQAQKEKIELGGKITSAVTSMPGEWIRSYGKTMGKVGTGKKFDFEDYLNLSDFVPGIGFVGVGGGIKAIGKKELVEKVGKEAVEETTEKLGQETAFKRLKHLLTYNDTLKKMYNLSDEELKTIGWKRAKDIIDTMPLQIKEQVGALPKKLSRYEKVAPMPVEEFEYFTSKQGMDVKKKVNVFDYLRTPEQVLDKIGLTNEKKALRFGYDNYQTQLREELLRIKSWKDRVPRKDSNQAIFDYLDGTIDAKTLNETELQVANEIKTYLKRWADRLGLPEEKRITNYITHLFEREKEGVEFPLEIAKKIQDQTAGSVYDPFLQERKGAPDFVRDTWRGLEAYVKRGTRKVNLDPALSMLKDASQKLDSTTEKYIQRYSHRINLRPTELDELFDNLIKQSPIGYRFTQRPVAYLTNKWRQTIFKGALGLNIGSAMRNLSQGVNTYAVLGEKYTALGYTETVKHLIRRDFDELVKHNVLLDDIVIDREVHAIKGVFQKMDDVLFAMFDFAEKVNRSSAYFGAKKQALDKGMGIPEAIDFAKGIVRKTQFTFNQIDTPVGMASDLVKALTQFKTYPLKQTEFLAGMVKDKNFAGVLRYIAGSLFLTATYGKMFGMDLKEFMPFNDMRFSSPLSQALGGVKDVLSTDERRQAEGEKALGRLLPLLIPGGVQAKKTLQGAVSSDRGYTATPTGRVRYPVGGSPSALLQLLMFGQYAPQEAREYYGKSRKPLGEQQSELFKRFGKDYYEQIQKERELKKETGGI